MVTVQFYIEGKRVQGIGYRAHLAMLALISGVERLYAENLPKERGKETVVVYAGARDRKKINLFCERVREKIPEGAVDVYVTQPKPYRSKILVPPVMSYVSTLTAGELTRGISSIRGLRDEAVQGFNSLSKDVRKGFDTLPSKLTRSLVKELVPKFGQAIVDSLVQAGIIRKEE